nr:2-dehydro-3-deoxygalactonokinase [Saprospiraceae bacterium]
GTSRFRIHLMDSKQLDTIASLSSDDGIAAVNISWQKEGKLNRTDFFKQYLQERIQQLAQSANEDLTGLAVFISGMASSSIGMLELPYAELPFSIKGEDMVYHKLSATKESPHDIYLLSGLASATDVMRGEEMQVIGLQNTIRTKKALVILPGTHSKHIRVEAGKVQDFSTFMTGEMFATTAKSTILSHSVRSAIIDQKRLFEAFKEGVDCVNQKGYLSALFKVRTRTLLSDKDKEQNFAFLSGVHLGEELRHLGKLDPTTELIICANSNLAFLYRMALHTLDIKLNSYVIPDKLSKLATAYGHLALAHHLRVD